jgi:hypothetical protein
MIAPRHEALMIVRFLLAAFMLIASATGGTAHRDNEIDNPKFLVELLAELFQIM